MANNILTTTDELAAMLADKNCLAVYSRSIHGDPGGARRDYLAAHIPGSLYIDLDDELADRSDLTRGRHPLPTCEQFAQVLVKHGIGREHTVVVYDDSNGSQAARLWWMLRWIGSERVSLLDGGLLKWQSENRPVESGLGQKLSPPAEPFSAHCNDGIVASITQVENVIHAGTKLLDARSPERFSGEHEHIDKRAGHIPGAINLPFSGNMNGVPPVFRSASELRARFDELGIKAGDDVIAYCGSGVTACHTLMALELAGIHGAKLYPGSWSEWIERHTD